jgi:hypothetical protein
MAFRVLHLCIRQAAKLPISFLARVILPEYCYIHMVVRQKYGDRQNGLSPMPRKRRGLKPSGPVNGDQTGGKRIDYPYCRELACREAGKEHL